MPQLTAGTTLVARYEVKVLEMSPQFEVERWLAEDKIFGRDVNLYVLDKKVRSGALARARKSAQLTVERIARVIDVIDKGENQRFIVTERPVGVPTAAAISQSPFTMKQAKAVIGSIAESLVKAAASHGLRHGSVTADTIYFRNDTATITGLVPRNFLGLNEDETDAELALKDTKGLAALTYFMLTGLMPNYSAEDSTPLPSLATFLENADTNVDTYSTDILNGDNTDIRTPEEFLEALGEWSADDMPDVPADELNKPPAPPEDLQPAAPAGPLQRTSTRATPASGTPRPSSQPPAPNPTISVGAIGGAAATLAASGELGRQTAGLAAGAASAGAAGVGGASGSALATSASSPATGSGTAPHVGKSAGADGASASVPPQPHVEDSSADSEPNALSSSAEHGPAEPVSASPEDVSEGTATSAISVVPGVPGIPVVPVPPTPNVPASLTSADAATALNAGGLPRFLPSTNDIALGSPKMASTAPQTHNGDRSGTDSPAQAAVKQTGFNATPYVLTFFLAVVIFGLVWAYNGLTSPTEPAFVAPTGRPTATADADAEDPEAKPSPTKTEEIVLPAVDSAVQLDPDGDENEHPELQDKLVDNDATTPWFSRTYKSAPFGGINKSGIGAKVTLKETATVSSVLISSANTGGKIEIRDGSAKHPKDGKLLGKGVFDGETVIKLDKPTKLDSVSVWVTELPTDQNGAYRIYIYEISLT